MKKVKTKDWGPEFRKVSNLMGLKAVAISSNEAALKAEVAAADGSHGYGRHGAQTGWESQFIRAVTQQTPDQVHDPMGVGATIRRWNTVMSSSLDDGSTVLDIFGDHAGAPTTFRTAAGTTAGGFATPEAQFLASARGNQVINALMGPAHYCAQYRFKGENRFIRAPITSVHVVVGAPGSGSLYGIGFARRDRRGYPRHTREFVLRMIEALQKQLTWSQIYPTLDTQVFKFHEVALRKKKVAFPSLVELADYFDLDVLWQSTCSLIFRRGHTPRTRTLGPWRLITMFPNNLVPGWAPSLFLTPTMKTRLRAARFNKNVRDYHWTGRTGAAGGNPTQVYTAPPWSV